MAANLLLSAYFLDAIPSPNPTSRALPVLAIYAEGRYAIDTNEKWTIDKSYIDGHYYSDKAPLTTWVMLPFYGVMKWLHVEQPTNSQLQWLPIILAGDVVCGSVPFVLLLWLLLRKLVRTVAASDAVLLCMLPLYGSFIFGYAGVYMSHILAGACLCGSYILLMRRRLPALGGFLLGLGVLAEFPVAIALPIWTWVIARRDRRELVPFLLGGLPCLAALLLYNHAITGSFTKMPYDFVSTVAFSNMRSVYGLRLPQPKVMWDLLFSAYRGMFFYAPALIIVALTYLLKKHVRVFRETLSTPLGLLTAAYVLLISSYFVWWGGWSYGPRHLIPLAMLLFYEGIPALAETGRFRKWLYVTSVAGLGMVWLAKSTSLYIMPEAFSNPVVDVSWQEFLKGRFRHDAIPTQLFGMDPRLAAWIWLGLFVSAVAALRLLASRTTTDVMPSAAQ